MSFLSSLFSFYSNASNSTPTEETTNKSLPEPVPQAVPCTKKRKREEILKKYKNEKPKPENNILSHVSKQKEKNELESIRNFITFRDINTPSKSFADSVSVASSPTRSYQVQSTPSYSSVPATPSNFNYIETPVPIRPVVTPVKEHKKPPSIFAKDRTWLDFIFSKLNSISIAEFEEPKHEKPKLDQKKLSHYIELAKKKNSTLVSEKNNVPVKSEDLYRLLANSWLNDEIINYYCELIKESTNYHCFNTFFYVKLKKGYDNVKKWTRKFDIFTKDGILVPVHLGNHWTLGFIDFKNKRIEYFDSLFGENRECLRLLKEYIRKESLDKKNVEFDFSGWVECCRKDSPAQENGFDCGVFVCTSMNYLAHGLELDFSQTDMKYFREKMILEIGEGKLIR